MITPKYIYFFLTARRTDSINIATVMWASFSWTRGSINSLLIQMGNKYFGQQHSHSRDIPHHVRRFFVGISDPLLGSYFHGRILHRILFKSSWSPDTRYPTWSTCCLPAVPILTCTSQQRNSHNTSVVNLTIFKLVFGNARAKSCMW